MLGMENNYHWPFAASSISQQLIKLSLRMMVGSYLFLLAIAKWLGPNKVEINKGEQLDILLTGSFDADNWLLSHIYPLANSVECSRVILVTDYAVPSIHKVEVVKPFSLLTKLFGVVPSRLITFFWIGIRRKPKIVGGFHLLFNGLVSLLTAKCIGARSMYFCVGGPTETLYGGRSENRLFRKLEHPDPVLTDWLVKAVSSFDQIITMGSYALKFFQERGVVSRFNIVSGAIDTKKFFPSSGKKDFDLIIVARLSPVKCIDLFLQIIAQLKTEYPAITAAIVGDGPLFSELRILSKKLDIEKNVVFLGHQKNVEKWLRKSKIFVLTSSSEGLALAMMEAMMCGLPAVVPNVGDLDNLVMNGVNGFLVKGRNPHAFATRINELLIDEKTNDSFSLAASLAAQKYRPETITILWNTVLVNLKSNSTLIDKR